MAGCFSAKTERREVRDSYLVNEQNFTLTFDS